MSDCVFVENGRLVGNNIDVSVASYASPIIITNDQYRFLVAEQALECGVDLDAILLEPVARNTAAV